MRDRTVILVDDGLATGQKGWIHMDEGSALAGMHMAAEGADKPPALYLWGLEERKRSKLIES